MIIRNNIVYDNHNAGIICSADCHNIIIEGNEVFNNGHGDNMRGIAVSKNTSDSIIRNNLVYSEDKCISIGRDSHSNQVYDNILGNCLNGVYIKSSYNNEIYDNYIENVDYGLVTTDGSSNNFFKYNEIVDAQIHDISEDSESAGNIFNDNKVESFSTLK
jgi:parallel beta-helix repeat protein